MSNDVIKYDSEQLALIRQTVAKDATTLELSLFLEFCKSTGLNPFKREIWFIKTKQGVQIMTGIAGFLTIANAHPQYDGMEVSIEEKDGKLYSATAKVYRKDRKYPSEATVYLQEYYRPSYSGKGLWETMPRMMLQKVAKSVALREAFSQELNGMCTEEEMPSEYSAPAQRVGSVEKIEDAVVEEVPQQHFCYELSRLPGEKYQKAVDWCQRHSVDVQWEDQPDGSTKAVATSTFEVPFFKEVVIDGND